MANHEQGPQPNELPSDLAERLKAEEYACFTVAIDQGTALFIKAPAWDILRIPSPVPIRLQHFLYDHPSAPVIRMLLTIYDQPAHPLAMDLFVNVEDEQARAEYAALAEQEQVLLLFHDEQLRRRRGITVGNSGQQDIRRIVTEADRLLAGVPREQFDYNAAKAAVMQRHPLP